MISSVSTSPIPNPIEKASKIPNVIDICVKAPAGPFTSIGDTSALYFGQKTEKAPTETPYINLPMHNI